MNLQNISFEGEALQEKIKLLEQQLKESHT